MKRVWMALALVALLCGRAQAGDCATEGCTGKFGLVMFSVQGVLFVTDSDGAYVVRKDPQNLPKVNDRIVLPEETLLFQRAAAADVLGRRMRARDTGYDIMAPGTTVKVLGYQWLQSPDGKDDGIFMIVHVLDEPFDLRK